MLIEFRNEPMTNYSLEENANAMQTALNVVSSNKGKYYPLIIGGEKIDTEKRIVSINPSKTDEIIGTVASADTSLAEKAVTTALETFETWKKVKPVDRADCLFKAAAIIRRKKHEFNAWLSVEAGKTWAEADGETAETIDFLEYYGRQMLQMENGMNLTPYPGQHNECKYIPLGVGLVISPWNFPLAIMAGMTMAAVVSGNTVVLKPASTTPVIAAKFMEVLEEAGVPKGVVNYLPGPGGEVGDYLVKHPKIRFISFTGSKEVGLRINKLAAEKAPEQIWIKRVVAEMGGKNSIIVDDEADLDSAALGIVEAAFGFQGQKCSACSRAIVLESVYDKVVDKISTITNTLKVGLSSEYGTNVGPVIDDKSYNKILEYIEKGKQEGKLICGGEKGTGNGYFIMPTVIKDVSPVAKIAQEEIFGPVLAIIKASTFVDAIAIANNTEYGLTGSVYSKNRAKLSKARDEFHVGNLYLNKKSTGALVGVHPFGGFNMSGTDSKAGGTDYLLQFMQPKTVCEAY